MVKTKPITDLERELLKAERISLQLPVLFANGNTVSEFAGQCACCGKEIPDRYLSGNVVRQIETLVRIDAVGVCPECKIATPFSIRFRDNMTMEFVGKDGHWLLAYSNGEVLPMGAIPTPARKSLKEKVQAITPSTMAFLILFLPLVVLLLLHQ